MISFHHLRSQRAVSYRHERAEKEDGVPRDVGVLPGREHVETEGRDHGAVREVEQVRERDFLDHQNIHGQRAHNAQLRSNRCSST